MPLDMHHSVFYPPLLFHISSNNATVWHFIVGTTYGIVVKYMTSQYVNNIMSHIVIVGQGSVVSIATHCGVNSQRGPTQLL